MRDSVLSKVHEPHNTLPHPQTLTPTVSWEISVNSGLLEKQLTKEKGFVSLAMPLHQVLEGLAVMN